MCQICKDAQADLEAFMVTLEDKYPGQEVRGTKVARAHHATVAAIVVAQDRFERELAEVLGPSVEEEAAQFAEAVRNLTAKGSKLLN